MQQYRLIYLSCVLVLLLATTGTAKAQSFSFNHLTTYNGLSDNNVRSLVIDKKGFLWIGTIDGLNVYDGYTVSTYRKANRPAMASNNVIHLTCDSRNRIWLGMMEGVTWVDEKRQFHRVVLYDSITDFVCRTIQDTRTYGPVLYTSLGQFYYNEKNWKWERLDWLPDMIAFSRFHDADPFDEDKIIYATDSIVMIADYAGKNVFFQKAAQDIFSVCRYSDHEVAIGKEHGLVEIIDICTGKVTKSYRFTSQLDGKKINATITEVRSAGGDGILVGTGHAGFFIIDAAGNMSHYEHNPVNKNSLGSNMTWRVLSGRNGDIFVGTSLAGVSISNINNRQADYLRLMSDSKGRFYDSYINTMLEDEQGVIWITALERLIRWDKEKNTTAFYFYQTAPIWNGSQNIQLKALCQDRNGRLWVSALGDGLAIFDKTKRTFHRLPQDTAWGIPFRSHYILDLHAGTDGNVWVASTRGLYAIDPINFKRTTSKEIPALKVLDNQRINAIKEDSKGNLWLATDNALYYFDKKQRLTKYTTQDGLASNNCYALHIDAEGRVFVGTAKGFSVFENTKWSSYTTAHGLKYDICEAITGDKDGHIWITNNKQLLRYNVDNQKFISFDENAGLTQEGFRIGSALTSRSGQLFFGSHRGLNYFLPSQLLNAPSDLQVNIYEASLNDSSFFIGTNDVLRLQYNNNSISFRFTANNMKGSYNIQYQYKLDGYEHSWQNGRDIREARYSSLPPGSYVFRVKASVNGHNWKDASNHVSIIIKPPVWKQAWFILTVAAIIFSLVYWFITNRNRKLKEKQEELEAEQAINYFASSIYETHSVKAILWDVAKNCIGRLHFEDCVIYLIDYERQVLVQRAAHGPKSPEVGDITAPIEIPLGKGITGWVALSGKAEIVDDTSKDPRYITDIQRMSSEITVPIVYDGKVLGVIDCEHSKKKFFTQKHLSILTTIASLCANKIVKAKAEAEKAKAEAVLMDTQRKMADIEMQALRAQMNPHFIFNCLNSINRYIVKSDQATASLYLTRFAKLIRLILDNSNSQSVTLTNELEALRLYIEMESIRFEKQFTYTIDIDTDVHPDSVYVPPLIIQPYVENAIWHGLLHKETAGHLQISLHRRQRNLLECIIEDNGIGRDKAKELKSKSASSKKSLGMKLTEDRLSLLGRQAQMEAVIAIQDIKTATGEAGGTRVVLKIPIDA